MKAHKISMFLKALNNISTIFTAKQHENTHMHLIATFDMDLHKEVTSP